MAKAKIVGLAVLVVLLLTIVFQNTAETTVRLLVFNVTMPLALLLVVVLAGGALCGLLGSLLVVSRANRNASAVRHSDTSKP